MFLKNGFGILELFNFRIPIRIPVGKSSWLFLMTSIVLCALTFMQSNVKESLDKKSWSHFLYYYKSQNGKICPFANVKKICNLRGSHSVETNLQNGNLRTGWSISYNLKKKDWICPIQIAKSFPDQMSKLFPIWKRIYFAFQLLPY